MRILYFYQYFGTPEGAWSTRSYEFARRWVAAGDQVTVITARYDKSDLEGTGLVFRADVEGIDVRVINLPLSNKHGRLVRVLTFLAYALAATYYALALKPDVVLASSGPITVGIPALAARWLRRRPMVFEVRDLWPEGAISLGVLRNPVLIGLARALERWCYRAATRVVVLSEGMRAHLAGRGVPGVAVVPNASDNALFGPRTGPGDGSGPAPDGVHRVVYAGTLGLIDDCMQIIRMAEVLERRGVRDVEVEVIGDGREGPAIREYVARNGPGNVRLLGVLPKTRVADHLRRASCALLTTKPIPFLDMASPNKLFDAFAAGAPVVQTTQGWIRDLLDAQRCGITVPGHDPEAMADAVQAILDDPELRTDMRRNALRLARETFDRDRLAEQLRTILQDAARSGQPAR